MSLTGSIKGKTLRGSINRLHELRGYSAYEVALLNGFEGTEEEWLESLKGESYVPTDEDLEKIAGMVDASPAAELAQSIGISETAAMSQKAVTEVLHGLNSIGFTAGSINGSSGMELSNATRRRSDYISVCGDEVCLLSDADYQIFGHFYAADNTYLGNTGWQTSFALADYIKEKTAITQLRVVIRRNDDGVINADGVADICWLVYNKFDRKYAKSETVADLGSKDVFALDANVIYENSYQGADGQAVEQEGCSVYRLFLGEEQDTEGNVIADYTYLYGKTIKIKTYAYGAMAYGFEGAAGTLINPDADIENDPVSGVCEFEVTLPEYTEGASEFFHISFCENAYTGFAIYEKKGTAWEEIKALWQAANALTAQQLMYEITKMSELCTDINLRVRALEANTPAVYDGSVTVE